MFSTIQCKFGQRCYPRADIIHNGGSVLCTKMGTGQESFRMSKAQFQCIPHSPKPTEREPQPQSHWRNRDTAPSETPTESPSESPTEIFRNRFRSRFRSRFRRTPNALKMNILAALGGVISPGYRDAIAIQSRYNQPLYRDALVMSRFVWKAARHTTTAKAELSWM